MLLCCHQKLKKIYFPRSGKNLHFYSKIMLLAHLAPFPNAPLFAAVCVCACLFGLFIFYFVEKLSNLSLKGINYLCKLAAA